MPPYTPHSTPSASESALNSLANTLRVSPSALKVALTRAFDLLPSAQYIPALALHMSLASMGWRIDTQTLYAAVGEFRRFFRDVLGNDSVSKEDVLGNEGVDSRMQGYEVPALSEGNRLPILFRKSGRGEELVNPRFLEGSGLVVEYRCGDAVCSSSNRKV